MQTFVKVIQKLYWLGIIGLAGIFFDIPALKWFTLFFLLGILDFILSFILVLRTEGSPKKIHIHGVFVIRDTHTTFICRKTEKLFVEAEKRSEIICAI